MADKEQKDRKAEIERRKKRLDELRQAKEARKKELKGKEELDKLQVDPLSKARQNVDELVDKILGPKGTSPTPISVSPTPGSVSIGTGGGRSESTEPITMETPTVPIITKKREMKLSIDSLLPINIKPKTIEQYEKCTQTDSHGNEIPSDNESDENEIPSSESPVKPEPKDKDNEEIVESGDTLPLVARNLSDEEKQEILISEDFSMFIERSSRVMERVLADTTDILFDLAMDKEEEGEDLLLASINVVRKKQLSDSRWTKGRIVSSMAWSPHHPGILLASYYQQETTSMDPDGVVLMWDLKFDKDTPDYIFNCHSPIMSVTFSRFHPYYVIGGTYSGQVVIWDIRSGRRTPVQRSQLSSSAHTHPIYCLELIGSQNAHNLISVSTNGKLCSWNLDNLSQPQESLELLNRHPRPVAVSSLCFPLNDVNKFVVSSEEGLVFQGQRHGKKPGLVVQYEGHYGTVTSVSCHQATHPQLDFSHLFVSSSIDWTVKLWSLKLINEQQITSKTATPLCSFEANSDYIYDVQWSPTHPALFVSVDGAGRLDFWNINQDTEVPILTEMLDTALARVRWSPNGQVLAVGDIEGVIYIYEAGEALCVPQPNEWNRLQTTLTELQQSNV